MPVELFSDNASTSLASSPGIAATSFTVASSAGFPAAASAGVPPTLFRVLIGTEMVTVTNVAGTTWTCLPLAAAHSSGDAVTHVVFAASLGGLQYPQNPLRPDGADFETFNRNSNYTGGQSALPSGGLWLVAVSLPKGYAVGKIGFLSAATAAVSPTHSWFGLYDKNRLQLALTADQLWAAWPAATAMVLPVATTVAGAASSFTTTYAGLHYLGILITAATTPTLVAGIPNATLITLPPILTGVSDIGLTTPPGFPRTLATISPVASQPYAFVGA